MSDYVPVNPTSKQQKINWMNTIVHVHDLQCNCDSPLEHTILHITNQEPNLRFSEKQKKNLKRCLFTEDTIVKEEEPFGEGELEALFALEDGGDIDTTDTDAATR